jgi:fatty acid desaturase
VIILAAWQIGLLAGMAATIGWWGYIVLWWLPVYVFTFLGDNCRSFAEHSQPRPDEEGDSDRLITFVSNPLERLLLAPMKMNYHAAHHLWPSIPYYNLPQADREMRASPYARALEWRGSYVGYLWRYYRALPIRSAAEESEKQLVSRAA